MTTSKFVATSPERTWGVFSDLRGAAAAVRGIEELEVLTEGEVRAGTRFRETRLQFKKASTEEMEITVFEPPARMVIEADSCGAHFVSTYRFAREGEGTRVDLHFDVRPQSLFAKLMAPLGKLMMGSVVKSMNQDMDDLAEVAERAE